MIRTSLSHRVLLAILGISLGVAASSQPRPTTLDDFEKWNSIQNASLTEDGRWLSYRVSAVEGDATLTIQSTAASQEPKYVIERGGAPRFTADSKFAVMIVPPKAEEVRAARANRTPAQDMPRSELLILNLATGERTVVERVASFTMSRDGGLWILYRADTGQAAGGTTPAGGPGRPGGPPAGGGAGGRGGAAGRAEGAGQSPPAQEQEGEGQPSRKKADHRVGDAYTLRNVATGEERKLENVASFLFTNDGSRLVLSLSTRDGEKDGIEVHDLQNGGSKSIIEGLGRYTQLTLSNDQLQLAFLTDRDDYAASRPDLTIHLAQIESGAVTKVAGPGSSGIPDGWIIADAGLTFSESGACLQFRTRPKPADAPRDERPEEERVTLDVWHWLDPVLQPQQLLQVNAERNRSYLAVAEIASGKIVQLGTETIPNVTIANRGDGAVALGTSQLPYQREASWQLGRTDVYLVDVATGTAHLMSQSNAGGATLSRTGKYLYLWDAIKQEAFIVDTASRQGIHLPAQVNQLIWDELNDSPSPAGTYGIGGWGPNDSTLFLYDRYDIWAIDPTGQMQPWSLTGGWGRRFEKRYRFVFLGEEDRDIEPSRPILLSVFDERNKDSGWALRESNAIPRNLLYGPYAFGGLQKAAKAETVMFTRSTFREFPDLWLANDPLFDDPRKVSDANPQWKEFSWGTAELINWMSHDGIDLQGIVYKPDNLDFSKKYPMVVYFYERSSDSLHAFRNLVPSASTIEIGHYVSNGYVVFVPDIPYKIGYPGESAVNAILPGVHAVLARGYVDPKRVGIQGQSWGGYQVVYMVTETDMFAAACAGAPVVNMFSAYGGIRIGTGLVRQFQYEQTQSRIGGSIWEQPIRFMENSPLFFLDKVRTPLLIMSNDQDDAVPFSQGVELITALRRLGKPSWMINYNGERHNLTQRRNRKDWSQRMMQFFDHYLKGAPAPKWMVDGIPAIDKGRDYGFDLVPPRSGG